MNYDIVVTWNAETSSYRADVPRLEGCTVEGRSLAEATARARRATEDWVAAATAAGRPIPEPENYDSLVQTAKYRIEIHWSEADQLYIANAPELPGCVADGTSYEEAVANLQPAIGLWMSAALEVGEPLPEPRSRALTA